MPPIWDFKCSKCDFKMPSGWGGDMYATDDKGQRIKCHHPLEYYVMAKVLGLEEEDIHGSKVPVYPEKYWRDDMKDQFMEYKRRHEHAKEIIAKRCGFLSHVVCKDCLTIFELDLKKDELKCVKCANQNISDIKGLIGDKCPKCKVGIFEDHDTGAVS